MFNSYLQVKSKIVLKTHLYVQFYRASQRDVQNIDVFLYLLSIITTSTITETIKTYHNFVSEARRQTNAAYERHKFRFVKLYLIYF